MIGADVVDVALIGIDDDIRCALVGEIIAVVFGEEISLEVGKTEGKYSDEDNDMDGDVIFNEMDILVVDKRVVNIVGSVTTGTDDGCV